MTQISFGAGTVIGRRTDVTPTQPAFFGITESWSLEMSQELIELVGQNKFAVDIAPGEQKISGKVKFARIQATMFGNTLFGFAPISNTGFDMAAPETITAVTTTFTVANGANFIEDLGVFYNSSGIALLPVTGAPSLGSYVAGAATTGTYTINVSDQAKKLDVYYLFGVTNLYEIDLDQSLMGSGPTVEMNFAVPYKVGAITNKFNIQVFAARFDKLSWQFKNKGYLVPEMDFKVFANAGGHVLKGAFTE